MVLLGVDRLGGFGVMHFIFVMHDFVVMYAFVVMHCVLRMPEPLGMTILVGSPVRMALRPFGMVLVHPAGIVLMPPVGLVPLVIGTVGAPSVVVGHLSPDAGMVLHELLQLGVLFPETLVVNQVRIAVELGFHVRVIVKKLV